MMHRRPAFDEYVTWAQESLDVDWNDARYRRLYDSNAGNAVTTVQEHPFFQNIEAELERIAREYNSAKTDQLLTTGPSIHLKPKPFDSVITKSFRKNVLDNTNFPDAPTDGWCVPSTLFTYLNDIVRGMLVCRYIDGPAFLAEKLRHHAEHAGVISTYASRQNDAGYYAYHFYVSVPIEINTIEWNARSVELQVEIQLTTQLQEVLKDLTHVFHEEARILPTPLGDDWKWQFETPRFKGSYIGHALHLLEGIILALKLEVEPGRPEEGERPNACDA